MRGFIREGGRHPIVILNPTITERAARVLAEHFNIFGNWGRNQPSETPRANPPPFPDARAHGNGHGHRTARTDYVALQQTFGRRNYTMADHGKKDDHGGGSGAWVGPVMGLIAVVVAAVLLISGVSAWIDWLRSPRTLTVYDNTPAQIQIVRQGGGVSVVNVPSGQSTITIPGPSTSISGLPTPQQVYENQLAAGAVTKVRVPCAAGFDTLPNGNCGRWVPN